jgi:hypothetical protein
MVALAVGNEGKLGEEAVNVGPELIHYVVPGEFRATLD